MIATSLYIPHTGMRNKQIVNKIKRKYEKSPESDLPQKTLRSRPARSRAPPGRDLPPGWESGLFRGRFVWYDDRESAPVFIGQSGALPAPVS